MLAIYTSGPVGLVRKFWMWIIPPMIIAALLLGLFYWRLFRESVLRKRQNEERRTLEIQKLQYENIQREMEQTRRLRHDMHHSLNYLSELLDKGEEDTVKDYLCELTTQISHRETVNYCKNVTVNGLLQYYVGMATDQDIQCRVQANCGELPISPVDLTVMLGNMMENAIRVCSKVQENRWIVVEIGVINGSMLIQVINPCQEIHLSGRYRDDDFLPAAAFKSDRAGGGNGLYSLEHTAEKYSGTARFRYDESSKTFTARIRLNLN